MCERALGKRQATRLRMPEDQARIPKPAKSPRVSAQTTATARESRAASKVQGASACPSFLSCLNALRTLLLLLQATLIWSLSLGIRHHEPSGAFGSPRQLCLVPDYIPYRHCTHHYGRCCAGSPSGHHTIRFSDERFDYRHAHIPFTI